MSCFWDGILKATGSPLTPTALLKWFRAHNRPTTRVLWQGKPLSAAQVKENVAWIEATTHVGDGHLTSTCDPFLCLLTELYECDIVHLYMGHPVRYEFARSFRGRPIRTFRFQSDRGHFWAV